MNYSLVAHTSGKTSHNARPYAQLRPYPPEQNHIYVAPPGQLIAPGHTEFLTKVRRAENRESRREEGCKTIITNMYQLGNTESPRTSQSLQVLNVNLNLVPHSYCLRYCTLDHPFARNITPFIVYT